MKTRVPNQAECLTGVPLYSWLNLVLRASIKLGWKGISWTNALFYFAFS